MNELPSAGKRGILSIAAGVVREPMFLLLLACGALYLILGDVQEAVMLLGFVVVIMGITIYQEQKTENTLQAPCGTLRARARSSSATASGGVSRGARSRVAT